MLKPTIQINAIEFQNAIVEYSAQSKRGIAELLNQKAYSVLIKAAAQNKVADRGKIISDLGQQATAIRGQKVRFTKNGVKRGKLITEKIYSAALYAIVKWKAAKKGITIAASDMESAARKELARRLSAVAFMKSGWLDAIGGVARAIGKPEKNKKRAKKFGASTAAKPSISPSVQFFNIAFAKASNTTDPAPTRWAEQALSTALAQETANMRQRTAEKLAQLARLHGSS